jgi:hypothetical protein
VAGQYIYSHGWFDQVDPKRGGRHLRSCVALERIRTAGLPLSNSRSYEVIRFQLLNQQAGLKV